MAIYSKMEKFRGQIAYIINRGSSIRSAWRMINSHLPQEAKIGYNAFYHFVTKNIKQMLYRKYFSTILIA